MQLSVPDRTAPRNGSFTSEPDEVKAWIDRLPVTEIGQTARLLFEALSDLNQQAIPAQQRFDVLEMLRRPVHSVTDHMQEHFTAQPLPLAPRNLLVAQLSREITHLLATGYKILVTEQLAGIGRGDKQLLVTAIHRATRLLSAVLLKAYQVYEPYPDCTWLELHSLYRYAEDKRLHRISVVDGYLRSRKTSTVAEAYKQILLLALACPYRLRQDEAPRVYQALEQWAPFAQLQPVGETRNALFVADLDSDEPPTYVVLSEAGANRNSCRALDTAPLAGQLQNTTGSPAVADLNAETLRRLKLAWALMPRRRYTRVKGSSEVVVSVGLSSIHYFVGGEAAFGARAAPIPQREQPAAGTRRSQRRERHRSDGHNARGREETPPACEPDRRIAEETPETDLERLIGEAAFGPRIDTSHFSQRWKMVNVSAGGYCLLWDNPEATRVRVGELLGIREQSDPDTFHWRLGVIRWLKCSGMPGIELGVQMLSPGAVAIAARPDKDPRNDNDYARGLLLPESSTFQQQATLLLPSPPFKPGNTAIANCQGRLIRVRLTKLVENTGSFAQFQFMPLGEVAQDSGQRAAEQKKLYDFQDVWSFL